jgi:hypothetical protein
MVASGVAGSHSSRRRWMAIAAVSIALHAGGVSLFFALAPDAELPVAPAARQRIVDIVDVVTPSPPAVVAPHTAQVGPRAHSSASEGALGRRGHATPRRTPSGEPVATDSLVDLTMSYEAPDNFAPRTGDETDGRGPGTGQNGLGLGELAGGLGLNADERLPPAPVPSLARPPRPIRSYPWLRFHNVGEYAGSHIDVRLTIDQRGSVMKAEVLHGLLPHLDQQAMDLSRIFKFYPAHDDAGAPAVGQYRWRFILQPDRF